MCAYSGLLAAKQLGVFPSTIVECTCAMHIVHVWFLPEKRFTGLLWKSLPLEGRTSLNSLFASNS